MRQATLKARPALLRPALRPGTVLAACQRPAVSSNACESRRAARPPQATRIEGLSGGSAAIRPDRQAQAHAENCDSRRRDGDPHPQESPNYRPRPVDPVFPPPRLAPFSRILCSVPPEPATFRSEPRTPRSCPPLEPLEPEPFPPPFTLTGRPQPAPPSPCRSSGIGVLGSASIPISRRRADCRELIEPIDVGDAGAAGVLPLAVLPPGPRPGVPPPRPPLKPLSPIALIRSITAPAITPAVVAQTPKPCSCSMMVDLTALVRPARKFTTLACRAGAS